MIRFRAFSLSPLLAAATFGLVTLATPSAARADDTIRHPGDHPKYVVEVEPHVLFGWDNGDYARNGFGAGVRVSIPIVENGFIKTINNSVAISFGADLLRYDVGCGRNNNYDCGAAYLVLPVALQWNFFVAQKWSVFGEPGFVLAHGFLNCDNGCRGSTDLFIPRPALYLGGRYHFNEHISLTMRIGYPTASVGVSFM
jgi:hypothetical protein